MKQLSQRLGLLRWFAKFILIMINQSNDTNLIMKFNTIFKRTQHNYCFEKQLKCLAAIKTKVSYESH